MDNLTFYRLVKKIRQLLFNIPLNHKQTIHTMHCCFFVTNSPLDIFKRSHRFFYATTYGTLAHLCTNIMVESTYAFNYYGPDYLKGIYFEYQAKKEAYLKKNKTRKHKKLI